MAEANIYQDGDSIDYTPLAALLAGDVIQLPDGRAAVATTAIAAGIKGAVQVSGVAKVAKTVDVKLLEGAEAYFDRSAGTATYWPGDDRDFYLGVLLADAEASATTMLVALNVKQQPIIDLTKDPFASALVLTAGTPYLRAQGGAAQLGFSLTAEAQKIDLLSIRSWPVDAPWILEARFTIVTDADADVADLNIGVANATHASDADSITESVFCHQDMGADANIDFESDDIAAEVAATDSTIDRVVGTPIHVVIDGRVRADIEVYLNAVARLTSTAFTLAGASGPLKALVILEKTSNDSPGEVRIDMLRVRLMESADTGA